MLECIFCRDKFTNLDALKTHSAGCASHPAVIELEKVCEHRWVFIESHYKADSSGGYNICYSRLDRFYCEKCLEQKEVTKREHSREKPEWFK